MSSVLGGAVLRRLEDGEEEPLNDSFNQVFDLARSLEDWRWKYRPDPLLASDAKRISVAVDPGGSILAHYAAIPVRFQIDGRNLEVGQIVDSFSLRRVGLSSRGFFVRLVDHFYDEFCSAGGLACTYGFAGVRHAELGRLKLRYCRQVPIRLWSRGEAGDRKAPHRRWLRWRRYHLRRGFDREVADRLWTRSEGRYAVAAVRDGGYFERRFTGRPGVEYQHLSVHRGGLPRVYGVLRVEGSVLSLAELLWDGDVGALEELDRAVAEATRSAGAERAEMWLENDPAAEVIFLRSGWIAADHPAGLTRQAVSFHPAVEARDLARRLYVTMADADLI